MHQLTSYQTGSVSADWKSYRFTVPAGNRLTALISKASSSLLHGLEAEALSAPDEPWNLKIYICLENLYRKTKKIIPLKDLSRSSFCSCSSRSLRSWTALVKILPQSILFWPLRLMLRAFNSSQLKISHSL